MLREPWPKRISFSCWFLLLFSVGQRNSVAGYGQRLLDLLGAALCSQRLKEYPWAVSRSMIASLLMNFFEQKNSFGKEDLGFLQVLKLSADLMLNRAI